MTVKIITHLKCISLIFSITVCVEYAQVREDFHTMHNKNSHLTNLNKTNYITGEVEQEWAAIYNGPGNLSDEATDIAVDSLGNVYVTGHSQGLAGNYDCATIKYDRSGQMQWVRRYDGGLDDYAYKLVVDNAGNVYITGSSFDSGSDEDYLTIKYNTGGAEQWIRKYNGLGNSFDRSNDIAVDDSGNVYVTGYSAGAGTNKDYITIKYDANGFEKWIERYNGPGNSYDEASCIDFDVTGNVYVSGWSLGIGTYFDWATIRYGSDGAEQWVKRYNGPGNLSDQVNAIAVDDFGNVFVTGGSDGLGTSPDCCTIKYNSEGEEIWIARYNGPENDWDEAEAISISPSGNIYLTGFSRGIGSNYDYVTIKYNSTGVEQWVKRYDGPYSGLDRTFDLVIDTLENVYVTGVSEGLFTLGDFTTIKYNSDGIQQWIAIYNGPSGGLDIAHAITVNKSGYIYVTGRSEVPGPLVTYDYVTIMYSQVIVPVELITFVGLVENNKVLLSWKTATEINNQGFEIERIKTIEKGNQRDENRWVKIGFVPGFGTTTEPNSYSFIDEDVITGIYKYRLKQIDFDGTFTYSNEIEVVVDFTPKEFALYQNYPNPFNSVTNIKYSIARPSQVILKIYNSLGQEVNELVNEEKLAGIYSYNFDAQLLSSGVYFYELRVLELSGEYSFIKKLVLLK